ncbi:hypothetical protein PDESU_00594 [Pontiella desulfatans]|uniref:Condensation domain-containing protein n=2 Tax=Pontiella desulfatans TaxID=2750659 RepID=A0A6C2TWI6_PONDE|nr:hypothetical protein PDESU_00594 [Pontiella desulfatans]
MIQTMWRATMRHTGGVGNASQIVLQLSGMLDEGLFSAAVREFAKAFPVLDGRESRMGSVLPFWRMPRKPEPPQIRVDVHRIKATAVFQTLEALVNTPFRSRNEYVVFHLLYPSEGGCLVALTFDHRLLDARGAEQFLLLLSRFFSGEVALGAIDAMPDPSPQGLVAPIKEGISSARCVGETVHRNVIGSGMIRLDEGGKAKGNRGRFLLHTLTEQETSDWLGRVDRDAGYLMFMPYALAAASTAFGKIAALKKRSGSFIVPCTTDLRPTGLSWKNTFFNHCSIFFFKVDAAVANDRAELIARFKSQFFNQTKAGFPRQFERFMALMRLVPLPLFEGLNAWNHASFSLGSVGKSLFEGETFCGHAIKKLYHMPLIPPQVGLGFFFSQINGRLTLGMAWRDGALTDREIKDVEAAFLAF